MKSKITEHVLSMAVVSLLLLLMLVLAGRHKARAENEKTGAIRDYLGLTTVNLNDPFNRVLFKDVMNVFYPDRVDRNAALVDQVIRHQEQAFLENIESSHLKEGLSFRRLLQILVMYLKFLAVYVLVMVLTYYGVQTLGVWRFVRKKRAGALDGQGRPPSWIARGLAGAAKTAGALVLFSPAYVIAYSIRTEFNTDTLFFMVLLGTVSNGLLLTYANKFHTFLVTESRKGYVETAVVKNLSADYGPATAGGIPAGAVFRLRKRFDGHVFGHIFQNARVQYLATIKEQASFLITGLIIIEMALNIHGCLNYEMLRQLLYKNYDIVLTIVLCIFYTVKFTEIFTDTWVHRTSMRYSNR
jgi:hypothetical protein